MTPSNVTAIIITLHHLSIAIATVLSLIASGCLYLLILRRFKRPLLRWMLIFILFFLLISMVIQNTFHRPAILIETVSAG